MAKRYRKRDRDSPMRSSKPDIHVLLLHTRCNYDPGASMSREEKSCVSII